MNKVSGLWLLSALLSSCIITDTPGFYSGYKRLSKAEKKQVVLTDPGESICHISNDKRIYAINAAQLLQCLKENDTSVVYIWSPRCHSKVCISMAIAQYYCDKNNYKLYVVAQYYDLEITSQQNTILSPVFAINAKQYGTDYCNTYTRRFLKELLREVDLGKHANYSSFFLFKGNTPILAKVNLFDTNTLDGKTRN